MSTAVLTSAKPGADPRPTRKDPYLSNAKLILIVLVVCGHSWEALMDGDNAVRAAYLTLYNLHMPAFILISGYLSRSFVGRPDQLRRLVTGIALPYLIFSLAYAVMRIYTEGSFTWNPLDPWNLLWFLVTLFCWRLTSPFWRLLRWPIVIAVAISLLASLGPVTDIMELGKFLQFLPFFVVGLRMRREHFDMLRTPWVRAVGLIASAGILAVAYTYGRHLPLDWIFYYKGYGELSTPLAWMIPIKAGMLLSSFVLIATFLAWVPGKQLGVTALGERTLYAYLLHGFVVRIAFDRFDALRFAPFHTPLGVVVVTLAAVGLALLLMTTPVTRLFRWVVEPKVPWLFRDDAAPVPRPKPVPVPVPVVVTRRSLAETGARGLLSRVSSSPARRVEPQGT